MRTIIETYMLKNRNAKQTSERYHNLYTTIHHINMHHLSGKYISITKLNGKRCKWYIRYIRSLSVELEKQLWKTHKIIKIYLSLQDNAIWCRSACVDIFWGLFYLFFSCQSDWKKKLELNRCKRIQIEQKSYNGWMDTE